jgi:hypothetical protein
MCHCHVIIIKYVSDINHIFNIYIKYYQYIFKYILNKKNQLVS